MTINNHQSLAGSQASDFRYFDLGRHWNSGLKNIFESDVVQAQLIQDFNKFVKGKERRINSERGSQHQVTYNYNPAEKPIRWDSVDWRCGRIGRPFSFDEYVCHGACHNIVNSLLLTARIAYPDRPWIIVTGKQHSTVWDQHLTFFDMNYFALKVSAEDCAINTVLDKDSDYLEEGELLALVSFDACG
jgi:hypothetical protein